MNDPGLDEPIKESSKAVHERKAEGQDAKEDEQEDDQAFLNPRFKPSTRPSGWESTDTWS